MSYVFNSKIISAFRRHPAFEVIQPRRLQAGERWLAVFDAHGTLFLPNWQDEYRQLYRQLAAQFTLPDTFEKFMTSYVLHQSETRIIENLRTLTGLALKEVLAIHRRNRTEFRDNTCLIARPGAVNFVKELHERGIPVAIITGSTQNRLRMQVKNTPFSELVKNVDMLGRLNERRHGNNRPQQLKYLHKRYPGHTIVYWDDWIEGFPAVQSLGGIGNGVLGTNAADPFMTRMRLIGSGVNHIVPGFEQGKEQLELIGAN